MSVGGLVCALAQGEAESKAHLAGRVALAKLVELRRRQYRLSAEDLSRKADVDLEDIVSIERGEGTVPAEPRTMQCLARPSSCPSKGSSSWRDSCRRRTRAFRKATVRFAAQSEPVANLLPQEQAALEEFVGLLAGS